MIELTRDKMTNAIARAKQIHPFVMVLGERQFAIESNSTLETYQIRFFVNGRRKLATCTCKAGKAGMVCYHVAAAAAVNIGLQRLKRNQ
jgi:hypothetical protein